MRTKALMVLALGLLIGAADARKDTAAGDLKKLEGTWVMVSGEQGGNPVPPESAKEASLVIKGDEHTVTLDGVTFQGTHKLDPTKSPRTINSTDTAGPWSGQTVLGIYELDGDEFRVCVAGPGNERPTKFTTKNGQAEIYQVWKRKK